MQPYEREPRFLIENDYLEKVTDLEYEGRKVPASRLGYRITALFADHFLGRIFETPDAVFTDELLRPETQDLAAFVTGVESIVEAQRLAADNYFEDGSVEAACPPLKALLHIMAHGTFEGMTLDDARLRAAFAREQLLASDWYQRRLRVKQERDRELWRRHVAALEAFQSAPGEIPAEMEIDSRLAVAREQLARVSAPQYLEELVGTIGADPFDCQ
jgi:broad specificity phosphatase PhoE